jgi:hypothetical protein
MRHLTVIDVEDWSVLFDGEKIHHQGHQTTLDDLILAANGQPVTLERVCGYDSKFEAMLQKAGDCDTRMSLAQARSLASQS